MQNLARVNQRKRGHNRMPLEIALDLNVPPGPSARHLDFVFRSAGFQPALLTRPVASVPVAPTRADFCVTDVAAGIKMVAQN